MEEKKTKAKAKSNQALVIWVLIFAVMIGGIALLLYNVFSPKETRSSTTKAEGEMGVLECTVSQPGDALFVNSEVDEEVQKVKIMLRDDKPGEVSYEYSGTFADEATAKSVTSRMNADYNIYLKSEVNELSSVFNAIDNEAKVTVYADGGKLNSANAKVFFLTTDEMLKFYDLSRNAIEKLYQKKGFSCEYRSGTS